MNESLWQGDRSRPAQPRVRLVDVAREAGLSKTTISAALNGTGRLSPAVRERARETARRLGYRPNATARMLRAGHARLIGYAVREYVEAPWAYTEFAYYAQLTSAACTTALAHGYAIVILPTRTPRDAWLDLPLDAAVVADPVADDPLVDDFLAAGIPVVSDRRVKGRPDAFWVDNDHDAATREVLDHLADAGARRIGLLTASSTALFYEQVMEAYLRWCAEHDMAPHVTLNERPGNGPAVEAVQRALGGPDRPDALITLVDVSPPLLIDAARRLGLSVPEDLLLVCVTEDSAAEFSDPPITTLSLRPRAIATAGIELLVNALEGEDSRPSGLVVPTHLEIRASSRRCSPVPSSRR
ncbi:LacI family DNA-binding transcriptional regulator [Streptosporangium sp. NPDC000396]|uniref:LacI family DNA-binding transcriptional regulator n=1 Tax=Streptosporangium sp. NPDC000396 TaxID=3366185 RepID=UPI0036B2BD52